MKGKKAKSKQPKVTGANTDPLLGPQQSVSQLALLVDGHECFDHVSTIKDPLDRLPAMTRVMEQMVELAKASPQKLFQIRGETQADRIESAELDQMLILNIFKALLAGSTYTERVKVLLGNFFHKQELIRTINALTAVRARADAAGSDISAFMEEYRWSYFRYWAEAAAIQTDQDNDGISNSVPLKLMQVLFIMCYTSNSELHCKSFTKAPAADLINRPTLRKGHQRRESLKDMYNGSPFEEDAVLPMHPDWFAHNVPLTCSPVFTNNLSIMEDTMERNPEAYTNRMGFFRMFLTDVIGLLETQRDMVSILQAKIMGAMVAAFMFLLHTHYVSQMVTDVGASLVGNPSTNHSAPFI